jgi:hypothetical protein
MPLFGQDIFEDADKLGAITSPAYRQVRDHLMKLADTQGLATLFEHHKVEVLLALGGGPPEPIDSVWGDRSDGGWPTIASAAAVAGYPSLTGRQAGGLPVGAVSSRALHEGTLLKSVTPTSAPRGRAARRPTRPAEIAEFSWPAWLRRLQVFAQKAGGPALRIQSAAMVLVTRLAAWPRPANQVRLPSIARARSCCRRVPARCSVAQPAEETRSRRCPVT